MEPNSAVERDADEWLVADLHRLGLRHLARLEPGAAYPALPPGVLIAGLAGHRLARLRGALILLFLRRPSLSGAAVATLPGLAEPAGDTLRLYYQAAAYLRPEVEAELRAYSDDLAPLPDLFSAELGVPTPGSVAVEAALAALGARHAQLSGQAYNWSGSYRQHLALFIKQLKRPAHADIPA